MTQSAEVVAFARALMQEVVDGLDAGSNTDDMQTAEWIVGMIAGAAGIDGAVADQMFDDWWKKNGEAHKAWYSR